MKPAQAFLAGWTAALLGAAPCWAAGSTYLGTFGDWEAYTFSEKAGKVCYATSLPKKTQGAPKGRSTTFVSVTHRPGEKAVNEVSVSAGFAYKTDSDVEVEIGGAKIKLFTSNAAAWARDPATDKALVEAMKKGAAADKALAEAKKTPRGFTVVGTPAKGGAVTDSYSLNGFAAAYAKIGEVCGVK